MTSVEQTNAMYNNVGAMHAMAGKSRPRVTTTLWEDENTLCFQVEARGISVARREDNDMINGTKLLNVAGMTRGRRDGMLKAEKDRHVVKIGAMHLKGVWIPFDRAAAFAQKEGIADLLYPLFVEDIRSFLYRQQNPGAEMPMGISPDASKQGYMASHPQMQQMQHNQSTPAQGQMQHQLPLSRNELAPQQIPGIQNDQASGAQGKQQAGSNRQARQEDLQTGAAAGSNPQQNPQQAAYSRQQQYPYVPQYGGMQGYGAPMGSTSYPPYASSYSSYPQMVYGNQEYAAQQPMYYQNYQYDQNQAAVPQGYAPQQGAQQPHQQYYQHPQQPKPHSSPKEDGQDGK